MGKPRFHSAALRRLLVSVSTVVVAFLIAAVLMTWSGQFGDNFDGSFVDGLYFTLTTLTTIGSLVSGGATAPDPSRRCPDQGEPLRTSARRRPPP